MTGLPIVTTQILAQTPGGALAQTAAMYGQKSAGYARLHLAQPTAPAPFGIPDAIAIPPTSQGSYTDGEFTDVFAALTTGRTEPGVAMARSSKIGELPGQNPTLLSTYDPHDVAGSCARFLANVHAVADVSPDMGVLATMMVGGLTSLPRRRRAFGYSNVSFVADTHHPMRHDEMYIALVSGLGTRVVAAGSDAITITALRKNGLITHVGNRTTASAIGNSQSAVGASAYRQRKIDYVDLGKGAVVTRPFDYVRYSGHVPDAGGAELAGRWLAWADGKLQPGVESLWGGVTLRNERPEGMLLLGAMPIALPEMIHNLIAILQYLALHVGPVQIEGAFPTPWDPTPPSTNSSTSLNRR